IEDALEKLASLRISRFVSDAPGPDLESLGLQPAELEIALGQGTNAVAWLQFGKSPTNDLGQVYARQFGQNTIVTVTNALVAPWRDSPDEFRDRHLLLAAAPVEAIEVRGLDSFSLQRQTNDSWRVL